MTDKKIRVGVIGVGDFGRNHVRVFHDLPGAELVGIHDADPERARQVAAEFDTQAFPSVAQLAENIDAACVAVPRNCTRASVPNCSSTAWTSSWKSPSPHPWLKPTS